MKAILYAAIIMLLLTAAVASAEPALPANLQKIIDYNNKSTQDFALKVSFFIAFLAGVLGILSPCILPLLPAYFSYTFKEKKNITLMTLVFFLGFTLAFVTMGVIAGFVGAQALTVIQSGWLVSIAGTAIIIFGIMALLGKGFSSFIKPAKHFGNDIAGTFLFGVFFALGWTACLGPILAGILGIGAILHSPLQSGMLLLFYSLGTLVPLFILSVFYDKLKIAKFLKGKLIRISFWGKEHFIHSTNLISGLLFILIGLTMLVFQGTGVVNAWDFFGIKQYFYSTQNAILSWQYAGWVGAAGLALLVIIVGYVAFKSLSRGKTE